MRPAIIHSARVGVPLLILCILILFVYMSWWLQPGHVGEPFTYWLLFGGEVYHALMALTFWHTIWPKKTSLTIHTDTHPVLPARSVDVFITVAGEPREVVRQTVQAANDMDYPDKTIYILNDGYVANNPEWKDMENLAVELGVQCITRTVPGGAKAGNINHALKQTNGQAIVIFDADMVPHPSFLAKTMPRLEEDGVGFVQTPQFYENAEVNSVAGGSWEQQELFFGPIMQGKDTWNAAFICGTNFVIRRETLEEVGGMCEDNIAEDFLTSLRVHQKRWRSVYVPEVLARGLAPEDLLSYHKQQLRWARGSLEVLFSANPLFKPGLTWSQKIQYLSSGLYYLNGVVVLIDIIMPLLNLYFNIQPVKTTTTSFGLYFLPYIFLSMFTLYLVTGKHLSFRAISFSQSSWYLQLQALTSVLTGRSMKFSVTSKTALSGNFLFIAYPHIIYTLLLLGGITWGLLREGLTPSLMTNTAWGVFNVLMFLPFIHAAYPWGKRASYSEQAYLS